jgi:hypothetical protein
VKIVVHDSITATSVQILVFFRDSMLKRMFSNEQYYTYGLLNFSSHTDEQVEPLYLRIFAMIMFSAKSSLFRT